MLKPQLLSLATARMLPHHLAADTLTSILYSLDEAAAAWALYRFLLLKESAQGTNHTMVRCSPQHAGFAHLTLQDTEISLRPDRPFAWH